MDHCIDCSRL